MFVLHQTSQCHTTMDIYVDMPYFDNQGYLKTAARAEQDLAQSLHLMFRLSSNHHLDLHKVVLDPFWRTTHVSRAILVPQIHTNLCP